MDKTKNFNKFIENTNPFILDNKPINNISDILIELKQMNAETFKNHVNPDKNDFYNWILNSITDIRLARDIKNIMNKENMISIIDQRIKQLKDYIRHPNNSIIDKRIDMYVDHISFKVDNEICCDCEICSLVCPKEAVEIKKNEINSSLQKTVNDKCSKCGFCINFCPVEALNFTKNNEDFNFYTKNKMIPALPESKIINNTKAKQMFHGKHTVTGDCPKGCEECVKACPVNVIRRKDSKGKELKKIKVKNSDCLLCGACKNACPHNLIEIKRINIIHKGNEYCNAWNRSIEKLTSVEKKNIYHHNKNVNKIKNLIDKSGLRKY